MNYWSLHAFTLNFEIRISDPLATHQALEPVPFSALQALQPGNTDPFSTFSVGDSEVPDPLATHQALSLLKTECGTYTMGIKL